MIIFRVKSLFFEDPRLDCVQILASDGAIIFNFNTIASYPEIRIRTDAVLKNFPTYFLICSQRNLSRAVHKYSKTVVYVMLVRYEIRDIDLNIAHYLAAIIRNVFSLQVLGRISIKSLVLKVYWYALVRINHGVGEND